jgi:hypothetical protein
MNHRKVEMTETRTRVNHAATVFAFAALLSAIPPHGITAQSSVRVERRVLLSTDITMAEARQRVIDDALAEAVRQVVGTKIDATEQRTTAQSGESLDDRFLSVVQTQASGRVTDYKVAAEDVEKVPAGAMTLQYLVLKVDATVVPERGIADPAFTVSLSVNRPVYTDTGDPRTSDNIVATVRATQDGYLTLFGVSADDVQVLLPNRLVRDGKLVAATPLIFPSPEQQQRYGLVLTAQVPKGRTKATELIAAVLTKKPIPFTGASEADVGGVETVRGTLTALNRWLVNIPRGDRAVAWTSYEVRKAKGKA